MTSPRTEGKGSLEGTKVTMRIGEVASTCGLTTRTLRYWQEIGLLMPSGHSDGGERLYSATEVERATRIRELQELLGLSLAEIRVVLDTEDTLDRLRTAYKRNARAELQSKLLVESMEANDRLLLRLDDTLARIQAFRDERRAMAKRLRARADELGTQIDSAQRSEP